MYFGRTIYVHTHGALPLLMQFSITWDRKYLSEPLIGQRIGREVVLGV